MAKLLAGEKQPTKEVNFRFLGFEGILKKIKNRGGGVRGELTRNYNYLGNYMHQRTDPRRQLKINK